VSTRPPLAVHLYGRHVADLHDSGFGDTAVTYTAAATAEPAGCRLSLSLPVRAAPYPTVGPGGRWVRALLPEGRALAWAVEHFGVPEDDRFGLISVLGGDVAGAVQVLLPGAAAPSERRYEALDDDALAVLIERAHHMGLGLDRVKGVRLSLAGLQDKVLLHRVDGRYARPINGAASTCILKPEPRLERRGDGLDLTGLATNELYCLVLAGRCDLPAAKAHIEQIGDTPTLVVERYDRQRDTTGGVERVHQEDLLGALGLDPLLKYERPHAERVSPGGGWGGTGVMARGGPSLADLAEVLKSHLGAANLLPFLQYVTFNVAIGNADAHARNYSVLLGRYDRVELAPLYDVICTRLWPDLDDEAAQGVNAVTSLDSITARDVVAEGARWGIPEQVASRRVHQQLDRIAEQRLNAVDECVALGGDAVGAQQVADHIAQRLAHIR
jgi:serine/threonine-protein kinase HipA